VRVLRDDPTIGTGQCDTPLWYGFVAVAVIGLIVFCAGLPLAFLYLAGRYYFAGEANTAGDADARERVTLLVSTYERRYWYASLHPHPHRLISSHLISSHLVSSPPI
jgi:hypothetical protein